MRVQLHDNPEALVERAMPLLLAHEEMNTVILGHLRRVPEFDVLATVETNADVLMAATRFGPHNLLITPEHPAAAEKLAEHLWQQKMPIPGVQAAIDVALAFANTWKRLHDESLHAGAERNAAPGLLTGATDPGRREYALPRRELVIRPFVRLTLYVLEELNGLMAPPGEFRQATLDDLSVLTPFTEQFGLAIEEPVADPEGHTRTLIEQERLFIWTNEANQPVSMAAWARPTPNGVCVNHVFTPAEHRGHGYATACVAKLSQYLLASGRRFVCLFADLANPTSNGIYQRIGYRALGEQVQLVFDAK